MPLPLLVICELLGVPWADWARFFEFSEVSIPGALDITEDERQAVRTSMIAYLREAVQAKAGTGAEDVFGMLSDAGLSNEEIRMFAVQLLVAGNETVRNTLTAGLGAFADHPEQWQRLRADRSLLGPAIEEVLRWSTPVIYFMRTAVDDTEFFGAAIAAGDPVVMLYSSADRDEIAFGPTAAEFDIGRSPNPHVSFGFGAHYCVGAALARQEIAAVLNGMLDRYPSIERAGAAGVQPQQHHPRHQARRPHPQRGLTALVRFRSPSSSIVRRCSSGVPMWLYAIDTSVSPASK